MPARRRDDVTLLLARPAPVPDGAVTTVTLPAGDPTAPSAARTTAARSIPEWAAPARAAAVVLVTDELVTNALLHAGGATTLRLIRDGIRLIIEVTDPSATPPRLCAAEDLDEAGRGMRVVASLADHWGTRPPHTAGPAGKTVWAVMPLGPGPIPTPRPPR